MRTKAIIFRKKKNISKILNLNVLIYFQIFSKK